MPVRHSPISALPHQTPGSGKAPAWEAWGLVALLGVHVALGVYYSVTIPIWEAHDEFGHYCFIQSLVLDRQWPRPGYTPVANDERHQPPLYYVLAALPASLVRAGEAPQPEQNPYMYWADAQGGCNWAMHDPVAEGWPYRGVVRKGTARLAVIDSEGRALGSSVRRLGQLKVRGPA